MKGGRHRPGKPIAQLVSVLDQNLGLVLKSETVPAPFWVVDHVEMPDEN